MTKGYEWLGAGQLLETWNFWMAPVGPLGTTSKIKIFITISSVLSSWAPPGFSCRYFINCMEITVIITIVTPNGLLNLIFVSIDI